MTTQTTTATIEPTDAERAAITSAEKRWNRGQERLAESRLILQRKIDDADIRRERLSPSDREHLEEMVTSDEQLCEQLSSELEAARNAPTLRVARERRGGELLAKAHKLDTTIREAVEKLAPIMVEADELSDVIVREFGNPQYPGWTVLIGPFAGSKIVQRLRFFSREMGIRGESTTFAGKLKAFRELGERKAS